MTPRLTLPVVAALLAIASGACPDGKPAVSKQTSAVVAPDAGRKLPDSGGQTIGTIQLPDSVLRLARGQCDGAGCVGDLQLERGGRLLGSVSLGWRLPAGGVEVLKVPEPTTPVAGLLCPESMGVWSVGQEERAITVGICSLGKLPDGGGVVVAMEAGFEHAKRSFEVFGMTHSSVRRVWQHTDGAGPHSSQLLVRSDGSSSSWVLVDAFADDRALPDSVTVEEFVLDDTSGPARQVQAEKAQSLDVVALGPFTKATAAAQARRVHSACLGEAILVRGNQLRDAKRDAFFLVRIAARDGATLLRSRAASCAPGLKSTVEGWAQWTPVP